MDTKTTEEFNSIVAIAVREHLKDGGALAIRISRAITKRRGLFGKEVVGVYVQLGTASAVSGKFITVLEEIYVPIGTDITMFGALNMYSINIKSG